MSVHARDLWSVSGTDYLAGERTAVTRSEWVDDVVYAMAGASKRHVQVVARLVGRLSLAAEVLGCL